MIARRIGAAALAITISGCAVSRTAGHRDVARLVADQLGEPTHWDNGSPEDEEVARVVGDLLRTPLTRERAVEIALVNNRRLQATYEELGVSQADMVQAGLLKNPSLSGALGFPFGAGQLEIEGTLVWDFLQFFTLPLRKKVARQQFDVDILRVAHEALEVAAETEKAFAETQAQEQLVAFQLSVAQTAHAVAELSDRLYEAGNITDMAHDTQTAMYQQARLDFDRQVLQRQNARERTNRLLGLWGTQTGWTVAGPLDELPKGELATEHLEQLAIRQRLDVDAARKQVALLTTALALAKDFWLFGQVEVGAQARQDPEGPHTLGPSLTLELPIFDQRQAAIAKLEAQRRAAERRLEEVSVDARSEVRAAQLAVETSRRLADNYQAVLVPLRDRIVTEAQLQYNGMLIGPYQLLAAKRDQIEAHRGYVEALRDYWMERAELQRVVGGRIR